MDITKMAFLVQAPGYWGRGKTLKEAALQVRQHGLGRTEFVIVDLVIGDDKPEVINNGMNLSYQHGSQVIRVGTSFELRHLLNLDTES